jgi:hypothetical protein
MAAKSWEQDFRYPAIRASIQLLREAPDDPFDFPGSFCIPVAKKPMIGWTPGRIMLIFLVLGFLLLAAGPLLLSLTDKMQPGMGKAILMPVAVGCSLSGIATFFLPLVFYRGIVCRLMGERAWNLTAHAKSTDLVAAELSHADRAKMKIRIDGDDYVLVHCDSRKRRLVIEGIAARYQIRADDVETIAPFIWMNHVGVEIGCRIDPQTTLRIAIARVSVLYELTRQIPPLFFLRNKIPNRLYDKCRRAFQSPSSADDTY